MFRVTQNTSRIYVKYVVKTLLLMTVLKFTCKNILVRSLMNALYVARCLVML